MDKHAVPVELLFFKDTPIYASLSSRHTVEHKAHI